MLIKVTSLLLLVPLVWSQVNQEIYSETDLLAIDSEVQEVREPGPASFAVLPPPGFQEASPSSGAPAAGPGKVEQKNNPTDGSHSFSYSLPDGTKHTQSGYFTPLGYVMTGSWEYVRPDGSVFRTEFTADHEGYKPRIISPMKKRTGKKLYQDKKKRKSKAMRFKGKQGNKKIRPSRKMKLKF